MFEEIKKALGTSRLESTGQVCVGCINEGEIYETDSGKVFLKKNAKEKAREMFDGEYESLKAIEATKTVKVPTPYVVVDNPAGGAVSCMEYLDMSGLNQHSGTLGKQLADYKSLFAISAVILRNQYHIDGKLQMLYSKLRSTSPAYVGKEKSKNSKYVSQFGFHVNTCCGYLAQDNTWCDDWIVFYTRRLQEQLTMIERDYSDREAQELWSRLQLKIPQYFAGIEVKPSLLHGDLWSGNTSETADFPVIFDAASFYGHHEFDLAIAGMYGGFSTCFWDEYYKLIPKATGWNNRHKLYTLFHYFNHWNHFGSKYKSGSLQLMKNLCQ